MNKFDIEKRDLKNTGTPVQAMPVERRIAGSAAVSGDAGVEASGWLDWIKKGIAVANNVANG
jgi:hypothetical protein